MKKGLIITCLLAITALACGIANSDLIASSHSDNIVAVNADYKIFVDENSLIEDADTIIVGEVIGTNNEKFTLVPADKTPDNEPVNCIYTVSDVKVIKAIKGKCSVGDVIKVKQLGGELGGKKYIEKNTKYFTKKMKGIFFLQTYDSGTPASTLNPIQGHITLKDNKAEYHRENKLFKNSTDEDTLITYIESKAKEQ